MNSSDDAKLALLASIFESHTADALLKSLCDHHGDVAETVEALSSARDLKRSRSISPIETARKPPSLKWNKTAVEPSKRKATLITLTSPEQIDKSPLPCALLLNVLPSSFANDLLRQMLAEGTSWEKGYFKLFDRTVTSPHVSCFYLPTAEAVNQHAAYAYNGQPLDDTRVFPNKMTEAHAIINKVTDTWMHQQGHLQPTETWAANVAFSNLYDGRYSSVGYHADQLTYLGPAPCIASLSLGVAREFRLKPTTPGPDAGISTTYTIRLPHNSLFIMGPRCQEDYKHSLSASPKAGLDRHAIAGNIRINITYRQYRAAFAPDRLHKCQCGIQVVLRCAAKATKNSLTNNATGTEQGSEGGEARDGWFRGRRYFWHCDGDKRPGCEGCGYFAWAHLDPNGDPIKSAG